MAAVAVKDVSSFLSSKQSEESDKDLAGEWAQLEELHNKKWVQGHKLLSFFRFGLVINRGYMIKVSIIFMNIPRFIWLFHLRKVYLCESCMYSMYVHLTLSPNE